MPIISVPNGNKPPVEVKVPRKEVTQVTMKKGELQKKSLGKKFAEVFLAEDLSTVKKYLMSDVIIPTIKYAIVDGIQQSIALLVLGDARQRVNPGVIRNGGQNNGKIDFGSFSRKPDSSSSAAVNSTRRRDRLDFDDIKLCTRAEAQLVKNTIEEIIEEYGSASVAEYCQACGITPEHTYENWGWTDFSTAKIVPYRGEFVIQVPPVIDIRDL